MLVSWSMQLMAVLGSLTAGEIAFNAMSTSCIRPNSTSCSMVRMGPMSNASRSSDRTDSVSALSRDIRRSGEPSATKWPMRRAMRTAIP